MKRIVFCILLVRMCFIAQSQIISQLINPSDLPNLVPGYSQITTINTKTVVLNNVTPETPPLPVEGDQNSQTNSAFLYGEAIPISIVMSDGNYTNTTQGKVWTIKATAINSFNVGLEFDLFDLSPIAEMYIYNESKTELIGPIKQEHFTNANQIGIAPINDASVIIYIIERNNFQTFQSNIRIPKILAGFVDLGDAPYISKEANIICNPSIKCSLEKMMSARAVARFNVNGAQCTGTLLNNELKNGKAYFLTAFHCIDRNKNASIDASEEAELAYATFQFQFWKNECGGVVNERGIQFSGAVLRAAWKNSDMVLLELSNPPGIGDGVNYAGWNRQTSKPSKTMSFIIHHPKGSDMRLTKTRNVLNYFLNDDFWQAYYRVGTVAPGSSGSALFNEYNQVIGQLYAGWSSCDFTDFSDRYGKFNRSFTGGGTSSTRLSNWLSPSQNLSSAPTLVLAPLEIQGSDVIFCSNPSQYNVPSGLEGCIYQWSVSNNLQIVSGQNTAQVYIVGQPTSPYNFNGTVTCVLSTPLKGRNRTLIVNKNVTLSVGSIEGYYVTNNNAYQLPLTPDYEGDNPVSPGYTYATISSQEIVNPSWSLLQGNPISWFYNSYNNQLVMNLPADGWALFRLLSQTSCGNAQFEFLFNANSGSESIYLISPNPVNDMLNISFDVAKMEESGYENVYSRNISEIKIFDKWGHLVKIQTYDKNCQSVLINISDFNAGLYTISISDGHHTSNHKFIKD